MFFQVPPNLKLDTCTSINIYTFSEINMKLQRNQLHRKAHREHYGTFHVENTEVHFTLIILVWQNVAKTSAEIQRERKIRDIHKCINISARVTVSLNSTRPQGVCGAGTQRRSRALARAHQEIEMLQSLSFMTALGTTFVWGIVVVFGGPLFQRPIVQKVYSSCIDTTVTRLIQLLLHALKQD